MAAIKGKDILIKIDMTGTESFTTFAGLRATKVSFNSETVDITNMASEGGWRELLAGTGVRSASISGSGVFLDVTTDDRAWTYFMNAEMPVFEIIIPGLGNFRGPFQITNLEFAGTYDGEATYEISLASGGKIDTFTPPPPPGGGFF